MAPTLAEVAESNGAAADSPCRYALRLAFSLPAAVLGPVLRMELARLAAICFSLAADTPSSRQNTLSHQLMCQCGCAQLLGECDHVGCPDRDKELSELMTDVAANMTDQQVMDEFVAKYGATVLAAPTMKGFDLVAWVAPFAVFAAALLGTILLIRRWGGPGGPGGSAGSPLATSTTPAKSSDPADRERLERIRRETDV